MRRGSVCDRASPWLIAVREDWYHRSGLPPAECGIVVTVAGDRTGDKVMRLPRMIGPEASRIDAQRSDHPPCLADLIETRRFPLDFDTLRQGEGDTPHLELEGRSRPPKAR